VRRKKRPFDRDAWIARYLEPRLSQMWNWYPPRRAVRARAEVRPDHSRCAICKKIFPDHETAVDHIIPKVDVRNHADYATWDEAIDRWLCDEENLQVLCKPCHKAKSNRENTLRRVYRRKRKIE